MIGAALTPEPAVSKGFTIERSYYTLDGKPVDLKSATGGTGTVKQNDRFVAVVKIEAKEPGGRVLLVDRLPAGFEIENPRLVESGDVKALDWLKTTVRPEHTEFRDDRFVAAFNLTNVPATENSDGSNANDNEGDAARRRTGRVGYGCLHGSRGDARHLRRIRRPRSRTCTSRERYARTAAGKLTVPRASEELHAGWLRQTSRLPPLRGRAKSMQGGGAAARGRRLRARAASAALDDRRARRAVMLLIGGGIASQTLAVDRLGRPTPCRREPGLGLRARPPRPAAARLHDPRRPLAARRSSPTRSTSAISRCSMAFEDKRFYRHRGVDPARSRARLASSSVNRRIISGGSTLTMQVARLDRGRARAHGAGQAAPDASGALQLERDLSKREILALYLSSHPSAATSKACARRHWPISARSRGGCPSARRRSSVALPQSPEAAPPRSQSEGRASRPRSRARARASPPA